MKKVKITNNHPKLRRNYETNALHLLFYIKKKLEDVSSEATKDVNTFARQS